MGFFDGFNAGNAGDLALGIGGLIAGARANKRTNETNMRINQMNNEFNERMMEKQMAWNEEMWNKQNEYNTASNQRARLEQAGLNPYLMMNGGSAGVASSSNSASAASASSPIPMQAWKPDTSSLSAAFGRLSDQMYKQSYMDELVKGLRIDNKFKAPQIVANLRKTISEAGLNMSKKTRQDIDNYVASSSVNDILYSFKLDNWAKEKQVELADIEVATKRMDLRDKQLFEQTFGAGPAFYDFMGRLWDLSLRKKQGEKIDAEVRKLTAETAYVYSQKQAQDNANYEWSETASNRIAAQNAENWDRAGYYSGWNRGDGSLPEIPDTPYGRKAQSEKNFIYEDENYHGEGAREYYKISNAIRHAMETFGSLLSGATQASSLFK